MMAYMMAALSENVLADLPSMITWLQQLATHVLQDSYLRSYYMHPGMPAARERRVASLLLVGPSQLFKCGVLAAINGCTLGRRLTGSRWLYELLGGE
jgi:hypothetical protein